MCPMPVLEKQLNAHSVHSEFLKMTNGEREYLPEL